MNLKSLELFGFKSFMRKLDIHFSDGITVIVGPNGCGKTNVTDALRWVLGEPNARNLRGKAMQDLIFNGTRDYKPLNVAEVSLTVDNSSGVLPIEYSEVTVTRRVFRNGESEFLINKVPCLLREIHDLFMDTGLGSRAYSIIEREMVEMVLADQPEKRRELLEEAAGIMKYKIRERQARRKLEATDEDMHRIDDVLREVERQVRALKRQVGAAQRFQEARDRQRELEVALAMVDLTEMTNEEQRRTETLSEQTTERDGASSRVASFEAEIESRRLEMTQAESALSDMQRQVDELSAAAQKLESENLVRRERREALLEKGRRLAREKAELEERVRAAGERRQELSQLRSTLEADLATSDEKLRSAQASLENVESNLEGRRGHLSEARAAAQESGAAVARLKEELANLDAHGEHLADRAAVLVEDARSIAELITTREREHADCVARLESIRTRNADLTEEIRVTEARRAAIDAGREQTRLEESRLAIELESARSASEMLRGLQESYEGFGKGPQAVLTRGSSSGLSPLADSVSVMRPDLITALDSALDSAIQFVVAPSGDDAVSAVRSLLDGDGQVTLVDQSAFRDAEPRRLSIPADAAIIGPARDFLSASSHVSPVLDHLLARTVLVESLEDAVRLARQRDGEGLRFVSRTGEWAEYPGLVHGGAASATDDTRILGRADRIGELERTVGTLSAQLEGVRAQAIELSSERDSLTRQLQELQTEQERTREGLLAEEKTAERAQAERSAAEERREAVAAEQHQLDERVARLQEQRGTRLQTLTEAEAELARLDGERQRRENELVASTEDRDRARQETHDVLLELERMRGESEKIQMEWVSLEETQQSDEEGIALRTEEMEATDRSVGEFAREIEEGNSAFAAKAEQLDALKQVRDRAAQDRSRVLESVREVESERGRWSKLRDNAAQHVHEEEMQLMRLESARGELVGRVEREFSVNLQLPDAAQAHGALLGAEEEVLAASRSELEDLRKQVERMGAVNLVALEQYERESKRYEFLKVQKEDLDEAREKLRRTIRKINRRARTLFMETLEQVRENFQQTFGTLFVGGQADIRLAGDEDPLHAPIEIFARPRGKRLASISLMSSGERSLTAVAFLFAIYLVKPSPFCILDEVDAPLDDANVGRFLEMLHRVAKKTQFVMITHNKKTMEIADYLYGVTMEEPGISKLVSVDLGPGGEVTTEGTDGQRQAIDLETEYVMEGSA
ncbi:MAG: chromosome partition protein Smc [Gemmatimonadota bacterium]|nr:MAG: chromosome partition protein Smc [Gemmatimonadota bacterium]